MMSIITVHQKPICFSWGQRFDIIKHLNFSKESPELLASRLHNKSLFQPGTSRDAKFVPIFRQKGWAGVLQRYWRRSYLEIEIYVPEDWSLLFCYL